MLQTRRSHKLRYVRGQDRLDMRRLARVGMTPVDLAKTYGERYTQHAIRSAIQGVRMGKFNRNRRPDPTGEEIKARILEVRNEWEPEVRSRRWVGHFCPAKECQLSNDLMSKFKQYQ